MGNVIKKHIILICLFIFILFSSCTLHNPFKGFLEEEVDEVEDDIVIINENPVPGNSGNLSKSSITPTSLSIDWTKATDNSTDQISLQYRVYYSTLNNIDNVTNIEANGTPADIYEFDINTKNISGLTIGLTYYFNVIVMDEDNNKASYNIVSHTMNDTLPPTPGNSGLLSKSNFTSSSMQLNWTKGTDDNSTQANLRYLVYYSISNNIDTVVNAETNGTPVGTYEYDIDFKNVTGLSIGSNYYFNVIIMDESNNKSAYASNISHTVTDLDEPVPGNSGIISTSNIQNNSIQLNWTKAADNYSAQNTLQYAIYYSTLNNIDNVTNIETNGTAYGTYQTDYNTVNVLGLTPSTLYYFNIIVRDQAGNKECYLTKSESTSSSDSTPPSSGNSGTITIGNVQENIIKIEWTKGTDNVSSQTNLEYLAYYSLSDNIDTVANIEANGTPFGTYQSDINFKEITGLTIDTVYYFNVIIRDEAGNKSAYVSVSQKTLADLTTYEAFYKFNDLTDSSGNAHDLFDYGATSTENRNSTPNTAYDFTSFPIDTWFSSELNFTTELTISVWVKTTNALNDQKIISKTCVGDGYMLGIDSNGRLYPEIWDSIGTYYSYSDGIYVIPNNTWTHIAMTWKTSGKLCTYVNGQLDRELNVGSNPISSNAGNYFTIGAPAWDHNFFRFQGVIDDIRIYGKELSQADIQALFSLPAD